MDKSTGAHKRSDTDRETHVAKLPAHIFSADVNKTFTDYPRLHLWPSCCGSWTLLLCNNNTYR